MRCSPGGGSSGSCGFNTRDCAERVADCYQRLLPSHAFTVKRLASRGRPMISLSATGHGAQWNATIGVNASGQTAVRFTWLPGR